ncbi:endonuclease/exonuclease/phosphatase family protein [Aeoliella mucimassa]|uniref:Endonuclease/Exonuclease/phosphatase family protein n=1 Tax=Aeoliella mucimassa TaxID=2527972 RepID=A0A518ATK9_9BACT|nr:endonuclease/exonuclease/phosphatase family protein [Aeoliella mucimassa]QDU58035.1 Endonuclease/Exonuclease/phosphatase family protein [Aeoliella mucimassa]
MKYLVFLLLLVMVVSAPIKAAEPLKVMTFNIRYDGGKRSLPGPETPWIAANGKNRRDLVLDVVETADPDLLGLQEALPHQVQSVCDRMKAHKCYSVGRDDGQQAGEHCTLLYRADRFEVVDQGTFWLCSTPDKAGAKHPDAACARIASWLRLKDLKNSKAELLVLNAHWDHRSQPAREYAAQAIVDHLAKLGIVDNVIVMGDFNANPGNKAVKLLLEDKRVPLVDCYRAVHTKPSEDERSFNGFTGETKGERIDYLLAGKGLLPTSAEIVRTSFNGVYPSDHYPIVVEMTYDQK